MGNNFNRLVFFIFLNKFVQCLEQTKYSVSGKYASKKTAIKAPLAAPNLTNCPVAPEYPSCVASSNFAITSSTAFKDKIVRIEDTTEKTVLLA
jgi:hypothetical protein